MGNACRKPVAYNNRVVKQYIDNSYSESGEEVNLGNLQKLRMYALTNPEKLPVIGKQLEKNLMSDLVYGANASHMKRAIVTTRIVEDIVQSNASELTLFIVNIINICDLLIIKSSDAQWLAKIRGCEVLNTVLQRVTETNTLRTISAYIDRLIVLSTVQLPNNGAALTAALKLRISAVKTLQRISSTTNMDSYITEKLQRLVGSSVLVNVRDSGALAASDSGAAAAAEDLSSPASASAAPIVASELPPGASLTDESIQVTRHDLYANALELLQSISRINPVTMMRPVLDTIFSAVTTNNNLSINTLLVRQILRDGNVLQIFNGYNVCIYVLDRILQQQQRNAAATQQLLTLISQVIQMMSYKSMNAQMSGAGGIMGGGASGSTTRVLEVLSSLIRVLRLNLQTVASPASPSAANLVQSIVQQIVVKSGGVQNIDMIIYMLNAIRSSTTQQQQQLQAAQQQQAASNASVVAGQQQQQSAQGTQGTQQQEVLTAEQQAELIEAFYRLIHVILSSHVTSITTSSSNKYFPDALIKYLCDVDMGARYGSRVKTEVLRCIQLLINSAQGAAAAAASAAPAAAAQQQMQNRRRSFVGDKNFAAAVAAAAAVPVPVPPPASAQAGKYTPATLSKKQLEDMIHPYLYKTLLQKDNSSRVYAALFQSYFVLLRTYRNKDLEHSIPYMFKVQEMCFSGVAQSHTRQQIQLLIAAYFYLLSRVYNNAELQELAVAQLASKSSFIEVLDRVMERESGFEDLDGLWTGDAAAASAASETSTPSSAAAAATGAASDPQEQSGFNKNQVIDILCRIDSLRQTYDDVRSVLTRGHLVAGGDGLADGAGASADAQQQQDDDDPRWDVLRGDDEANTETLDGTMATTLLADDDDALLMVPEGSDALQELNSLDFVQLGEAAASRRKVTEQNVKSVLALIPKSSLAASSRQPVAAVKASSKAKARMSSADDAMAVDDDDIDVSIDEGDADGADVESMSTEENQMPTSTVGLALIQAPRLFVFDDINLIDVPFM